MNRPGDSPQGKTGPERLQTLIRVGMYAITLSLVLYLVISRYTGRRPVAEANATGTQSRRSADASSSAKDSDSSTHEYRMQLGKSLDDSTIKRADVVGKSPSDDPDNETRIVLGLDDVRDGPGIEPTVLYYYLREVIRRGDNDVAIQDAPLVSATALRREPDRYRGRPVALKGSIRLLEIMKLPPNPSGVTELYDGWAASAKGREVHLCRFLCPKRTPLKIGQTVMLRGVFMKVYRYSTEKAGPQEAPLIIVNRPQLLETPGIPGFPGGGILITVLVVLLVVYFLMMVYVQRRRKYMYERLEARRKSVLSRLRRAEIDDEMVENEPEESGTS